MAEASESKLGPIRPEPTETHTGGVNGWTTSFDFIESSRRLRRFAAIERRLFELVGQWVQPEQNMHAKLHFGQQCYRHVRHAEMLEGLLPTPDSQYPAAYAGPIDLDLLATADAAHDSHDRLQALYSTILAPLRSEYLAHLDRTNPLTDAPTINALNAVLRDLDHDVTVGARLLSAA